MSAIPYAIDNAIATALPNVYDTIRLVNGFMIFTDGTMVQFTDDTVLYFGE